MGFDLVDKGPWYGLHVARIELNGTGCRFENLCENEILWRKSRVGGTFGVARRFLGWEAMNVHLTVSLRGLTGISP